MYTKRIGDIVARHGMQYHCYADDTQIYLMVERDESVVAALKKMEVAVLLASLPVQGNTKTLQPCCSVYIGCLFICDQLTKCFCLLIVL